MAMQRIYFDKTEIAVSFFSGKKSVTKNLSYDHIQRIQFDKCREFSFFRFVDSEKITITNSQTKEPLVYTRKNEKKFFDEYKQELKTFAKANSITLQDNTEN